MIFYKCKKLVAFLEAIQFEIFINVMNCIKYMDIYDLYVFFQIWINL